MAVLMKQVEEFKVGQLVKDVALEIGNESDLAFFVEWLKSPQAKQVQFRRLVAEIKNRAKEVALNAHLVTEGREPMEVYKVERLAESYFLNLAMGVTMKSA